MGATEHKEAGGGRKRKRCSDIMREQHDEAIGWQPESTNVPDGYDWPAYVAKLTALADRFR
ncbi:MAG: hypothetical protein ACRDZQ_03175 [Acidimicrobiales bacterium]